MYGRKDEFRKMNWGREIEPGGEIPIRTSKGLYIGRWGGIVRPGERPQGHARDETLDKKWLSKRDDKGKKIWHEVEIPHLKLFSERNTVLKNGEVVRFTVPDGHTIKAIARSQQIGPGEKVIDVRVVTEKASGAVKGVHHRMPVIREARFTDD
jgi:hypothetical protein